MIFSASGIIGAFAAASISAIVNIKKDISPSSCILFTLLGGFVIGLAYFGRQLSFRHYERNRFHVQIASAYRKEIEKLVDINDVESIRPNAVIKHEKEWAGQIGSDKYFYCLHAKTFRYWANLYLFLMVFGV